MKPTLLHLLTNLSIYKIIYILIGLNPADQSVQIKMTR